MIEARRYQIYMKEKLNMKISMYMENDIWTWFAKRKYM